MSVGPSIRGTGQYLVFGCEFGISRSHGRWVGACVECCNNLAAGLYSVQPCFRGRCGRVLESLLEEKGDFELAKIYFLVWKPVQLVSVYYCVSHDDKWLSIVITMDIRALTWLSSVQYKLPRVNRAIPVDSAEPTAWVYLTMQCTKSSTQCFKVSALTCLRPSHPGVIDIWRLMKQRYRA